MRNLHWLLVVFFLPAVSFAFAGENGEKTPEPSGVTEMTAEEKSEALREALNRDDLSRMEELLDAGADPNGRNSEGNTAAHYAAGYGEEKIALLSLLADAGGRFDLINNSGRTPLSNAFQRDNFRFILAWEQENNPDFSGPFPSRKEYIASFYKMVHLSWLIEELLDAGEDLSGADSRGRTAAWYVYDSTKNMMYLFSRGVDPLIKDNEGKTLLLYYLEKRELRDADPELIRELLDRGIDPAAADAAGNSPVYIVLRDRSKNKNTREIRSMILEAAGSEAVRIARAEINRENRKQFAKTIPENLGQSLVLLLPLSYIGLSVWTRENTYRDNPRDNWMAPVNGFVATGAVSATAGFFIIFTLTGGWDGGPDALGSVAFGLLGGFASGLVGGIAACAVPEIRYAFADNPFLYYLPSAAMGVIFTVGIFRIWLD
jgi:hypothetical protein